MKQLMDLIDTYANSLSDAQWQACEGWDEDIITAASEYAASARAAVEAAIVGLIETIEATK